MVSYIQISMTQLISCVLILIVVEDGLVPRYLGSVARIPWWVLILIVVEDGLVPTSPLDKLQWVRRLNPYCSGRWSRTTISYIRCVVSRRCLNPYCSGRWSRTGRVPNGEAPILVVLILIVVEDGLVPHLGVPYRMDCSKS